MIERSFHFFYKCFGVIGGLMIISLGLRLAGAEGVGMVIYYIGLAILIVLAAIGVLAR
ncbi:sucrose transport protein [Thermanaeromonas toyohensis ToBE]|uniref:Sucrose transport protein n=1 Tax=Thermanaeromonas toyohensis ToBE TaxID=698762 RepID=A0A1W1VU72_9FIRM|nr:sucrose transport protein [Thermanaeromonas toyohensis ToBE]